MIFEYILIISFLSIILILSIEAHLSKKPFLQILKNWCSIDSVHFEKLLKKTNQKILQKKNTCVLFFKKQTQNIHVFLLKTGRKFRSFIRKKLHPEKETSNPSTFITTIKDMDSIHQK